MGDLQNFPDKYNTEKLTNITFIDTFLPRLAYYKNII